MEDCPVLIVGAGPTGLVLALWLTKAGVPIRLIDQAGGPGTTSRALVVHARTLEFYRQMGIDRLVIDGGVEVRSGNAWVRQKRVARLPFGRLGAGLSAYPYALIFPQDIHEQLLVEQLEQLGVRVEREAELIDCHPSGSGVTAELQKRSGDREVVRAAYLAGCDGARSIVREKLGVGFPGGTYADVYYVADIRGRGPVINGELNIALDEADFLAVFPMQGEGRARLVGAVRQDVHDPSALGWDDVRPGIIQRLEMEVDEVKWFSTYRVHHRVASHFRKGNVFLLGDAAHIHSPVGGQGMNTGIGDAVNLAWKLAAVVNGASPAALLDTYEPERIAFARRLVATTDRVFAFVSSRGALATRVRLHLVPWLSPLLFRFDFIRRRLFRMVSQTAIAYPESPLSRGPDGTHPGGGRLPWVDFEGLPETGADNFSSLSSRQWQVHRYGDDAPLLRALCRDRGVEFHLFPWNSDAGRASLKRNAAYVIRPDGHIGIVDPGADPGRVSAYLDRWLTGPL
jgi:2-polyprenyl-6-methoxyphenol hydroxylase-like FAD-dependent oxidoreductase